MSSTNRHSAARWRGAGCGIAQRIVLAALVAAAVLALSPSQAARAAPGDRVWIRHIGTEARQAGCSALAAGPNGVTAVAGWRLGTPSGNLNLLVAKFAADGRRLWLRTFDERSGGPQEARQVAFDQKGNIVVGGQTWRSGSGIDFLVVKYSAAGKRLWVRRYDGPRHVIDGFRRLAVDRRGNVYAMGMSRGSLPTAGIAVVKWGPGGKRKWVARFEPSTLPKAGPVRGIDMALDSSGNVYVSGYSTWTGVREALTFKFAAADGHRLWSRRHAASGDQHAQGTAIAVRAAGVVVGGEVEAADGKEVVVLKYDLDGAEVGAWMPFTSPSHQYVIDLCLDAEGTIYATGGSYETGAETVTDLLAFKMKPQAVFDGWMWRFRQTPAVAAEGESLAVDAAGNVFVAGREMGLETAWDLLVVKFTSDAGLAWSQTWNGSADKSDQVAGIALGSTGGVLVGGTDHATGDLIKAVLIKYRR